MKITPYFNYSADCTLDGAKCTQSEDNKQKCSNVKPFSVKFEIDTRGTGDSLKLIMIRDKIEDDVEFSIYNLSNNVSVKGRDLTTYMTTVSYDKDSAVLPEVLRPV
jgi:hypothetical protein